jgi:hypothetical protein
MAFRQQRFEYGRPVKSPKENTCFITKFESWTIPEHHVEKKETSQDGERGDKLVIRAVCYFVVAKGFVDASRLFCSDHRQRKSSNSRRKNMIEIVSATQTSVFALTRRFE